MLSPCPKQSMCVLAWTRPISIKLVPDAERLYGQGKEGEKRSSAYVLHVRPAERKEAEWGERAGLSGYADFVPKITTLSCGSSVNGLGVVVHRVA